MIQCSKCQKKFTTQNNLLEHQLYEHLKYEDPPFYKKRNIRNPKQLFLCEICAHQSCSGKRKFVHHGLREHSHCFFCKANGVENWELHLENFHPEFLEKFICPFCNQKFQRRSSWIEHMETIGSENPFKCRFCPFKSCFKYRLFTHLKKNHGTGDIFGSKNSEILNDIRRQTQKRLMKKSDANVDLANGKWVVTNKSDNDSGSK